MSLSDQDLALARQYDLTQRTVPFFDRHLIYPILESLAIYDEATITKLTFELFKDTHLTTFLETQWKALEGDKPLPEEISTRKQQGAATLATLTAQTQTVLAVLSEPQTQQALGQDKEANTAYLRSRGVSAEDVERLYELGQFQYACGEYASAAQLLSNYRALSSDADKLLSATWGKLAAEIISTQWDSALKDLAKLREIVDARSFAEPLTQLHHRTWIIHWSLYPFFNAENGLESLLDLFFSSSYLSTIQAAAPWILRYLVAAVVGSEASTKNNLSNPIFQKRLRDLIRVVGQEQYEYHDPLTDFIKALYIDFDFEEANAKLNESTVILKTDFFLSNISEIFVKNAKQLISEVYCRVHQRINLQEMSRSLDLSPEDGEKNGIANLIKETKLAAKIDEAEGSVILNHPQSSVYQQVIERTKGLSFKANQILATALQKQDAQ